MPGFSNKVTILVRGSGDIASAVALRLWQANFPVFLHEEPLPTVTRRGMSFTDAVFGETACLEGICAQRVVTLSAANSAARAFLPLLVGQFPIWLEQLRPQVLIDARMRKHQKPENLLGLAPLTLGLGPGFVAGENTTLAVETAWGENLGQVMAQGAAQALSGEPAPLGGASRERYVYSPAEGVFRTEEHIGALAQAGQTLAWVENIPLQAPLSGVVRGLTHDGVPVKLKTKVIEIDPRGEPARVFGVAQRAEQIAQGILQALRAALQP